MSEEILQQNFEVKVSSLFILIQEELSWDHFGRQFELLRAEKNLGNSNTFKKNITFLVLLRHNEDRKRVHQWSLKDVMSSSSFVCIWEGCGLNDFPPTITTVQSNL